MDRSDCLVIGAFRMDNKESGANRDTIPANPRKRLLEVINTFVFMGFS